MRYLVGNWKSYTTVSQTGQWLNEFTKINPKLPQDLLALICTPFTSLAEANRLVTNYNLPLQIGAQDVSAFIEGRHTGEITAQMLSELTSYCLVGHSERRREFNETSQLVAQKAMGLLEHSITPIVCLDTPYLEEQIKALLNLQIPLNSCFFAYEPLSAIGTGKPADPHSAFQVATQILFLTEQQCPLLYGGSITHENVKDYVDNKHFTGVLVGSDSLTAENFAKLISALSL